MRVCWRRSFALKHLCVLLYLCRCVHSVPSPDLENSQLLFLYIISLFLSPSLLLLRHPVSFLPILVESEVSQRISSLKKKRKKEILVLSWHLPESFYLWTHALSTPYGLHFQCFAIHPSSHLLSSSAPKFLFKSFHYFRNCSLCSLFLFLS